MSHTSAPVGLPVAQPTHLLVPRNTAQSSPPFSTESIWNGADISEGREPILFNQTNQTILWVDKKSLPSPASRFGTFSLSLPLGPYTKAYFDWLSKKMCSAHGTGSCFFPHDVRPPPPSFSQIVYKGETRSSTSVPPSLDDCARPKNRKYIFAVSSMRFTSMSITVRKTLESLRNLEKCRVFFEGTVPHKFYVPGDFEHFCF